MINLVDTGSLIKKLHALPSMRVDNFGSRQIAVGKGRQGGGNAAAGSVQGRVQDRFASVTRGIGVVVYTQYIDEFRQNIRSHSWSVF